MNYLEQQGNTFSESHMVLSTSLGWWMEDAEQELHRVLEELLNTLMWEYQVMVVVVVPAGNNYGYKGLEPTHYPAILAKKSDFPMIVVGAVNPMDGNGYAWSNMMTPRSMNAPGIAECAGRSGEDTYARGAGVAMAHVAGLALYFLSLEDLGNALRRELANSIINRMVLNFIHRYSLSIPGALRGNSANAWSMPRSGSLADLVHLGPFRTC